MKPSIAESYEPLGPEHRTTKILQCLHQLDKLHCETADARLRMAIMQVFLWSQAGKLEPEHHYDAVARVECYIAGAGPESLDFRQPFDWEGFE